MITEAVKLFYVYSQKDGELREALDVHLAALRREGLLSTWHDQDVALGLSWAQEAIRQLDAADIVLLLVSSDFIASDYCYGVEMQRALQRHAAGETTVIPVILRPVDWRRTPFATIQALPKDGKPVVLWPDRDSALMNVVEGIRQTIYLVTGRSPEEASYTVDKRSKYTKRGLKMEENTMVSTPAGLTPAILNRAITRYHKDLKSLDGYANHELALRFAFQNLLTDTARSVNLTLVPEQTLEGGIRPDGVLRDTFFRRGIWEAKGPEADLEQEIRKKRDAGYPLENALFENTRIAILYQDKKRHPTLFDLDKASDIRDLLRYFLTHTEPEIEGFEAAIQEFKHRIPELAQESLAIIDREYQQNQRFIAAFNTFVELCRTSLNPQISLNEIKEMLIQHLLTERLFRTIFQNSDFVNRNIIAAEIEKVIQALTSRSFNRQDFLKRLDRFYVAIEAAAKGIENWSERQHFLNTVYERFFQGFSVKKADTHGIVYTPQEIVDFMVASVDEVLKKEFGKSLGTPGVKVLDPATGTGNFIVNLMKRIPRSNLREKYLNDLFCNEITLLPYYIASLNIEHEYYERMGEYLPFEGICFTDTLELAESQQLSFFVEKNTERVEREKAAEIKVIMGNPPYNAWQKNENDNNKNRRYPIIDQRVKETYVNDSAATNRMALSDMYVRFFRWSADRLAGRDGVVCLVTNNSFVDQIAFDGMRKHLMKEFTQIYHIDLHGNIRKNPHLSGTTHNVFGIQVGVGITIAVRSSLPAKGVLYYYRMPEDWRKTEKLDFLRDKVSIAGIEWTELEPDNRYTWLTSGLSSDFSAYVALGTKEAKGQANASDPVVFRSYCGGVKTNRDAWVYNFHGPTLTMKVRELITTYNNEITRWQKREDKTTTLDDFLLSDDTRIKWSSDLKLRLVKGNEAHFIPEHIRHSLYRPFTKKSLYFDNLLNDRIYLQNRHFPTPACEAENKVIWLKVGSDWPMFALAVNVIPDLLPQGGSQCFPYYTYAEDGSQRRENITDWALAQFQAKYGSQVIKWDIFYYIYAMLHHPQYRERYAENLKRDLPRVPLLTRVEAYQTTVEIGRQLVDLHLHYEQATEYPLKEIEDESVPYLETRRVEKMRLSSDRTSLVVNDGLTLSGIPEVCFLYCLGNRSALEWIIDQYQVTTDARSGITSDPNRLDEPEYIVKLVKQVVEVSVKTVAAIDKLAREVTQEDWLVATTLAADQA